jgi:hypothetical protein
MEQICYTTLEEAMTRAAMTRAEAVQKIAASRGRIFALTFIKRTTGERRDMVCRLGVTAHLKGGKPGYDAKAKGLLVVFDLDRADYRAVPVEGITRVTIDGETYTVNGDLP